MERQCFGLNPETGRVEHHYVWLGKGHVDQIRGSALAAKASAMGTRAEGRKVQRAGV